MSYSSGTAPVGAGQGLKTFDLGLPSSLLAALSREHLTMENAGGHRGCGKRQEEIFMEAPFEIVEYPTNKQDARMACCRATRI